MTAGKSLSPSRVDPDAWLATEEFAQVCAETVSKLPDARQLIGFIKPEGLGRVLRAAGLAEDRGAELLDVLGNACAMVQVWGPRFLEEHAQRWAEGTPQ